MKTVIVSCLFEKGNLSYPLGGLCIEAALLCNGTDVKHFACYLGSDEPLTAATRVCAQRPGVVICSVYLWNRQWFDTFTAAVKKKLPGVVILAGGPEVTASYRSFDADTYDVLVAGEGEEADVLIVNAVAAAKDISSLDLPGLILPEGGSYENSVFSYACPADLESVPSVILSGCADSYLNPEGTVLWEITRGCPFKCDFCFESKGQRTIRRFSFERIEKELEVLVEKGVCDVFVLDPTFNTDKKLAAGILKLLIEKAPQEMHFSFEVRAELIDEELAVLFSRLNCALQIGLQSTNGKALKAVNRSFDEKVFTSRMNLLNKYGIVFGLDLIAGLPFDDFNGFTKSLDYAISCKPSNIDIFKLAILPGTALADNAENFDLVYEKNAPYLLKSSPSFSKKDLVLSMRLKEACDLFYTKAQSHMWFHTICEASGLTPTGILIKFWEYAGDCSPERWEDDDLYEMEDSFVKYLLRDAELFKLHPAVLSFMEFHQALNFLLETGQSPVAELRYDPNTLSLLDTMNVNEFVKKHKPFSRPKQYQLSFDADGTLMFEVGL